MLLYCHLYLWFKFFHIYSQVILIQNIFLNGFGGTSCEVPMNLFHFSLTQLKVTKLNVLCKGVEKDSIKELNIDGETIHLGIVSYSSRMEETVGGQFLPECVP